MNSSCDWPSAEDPLRGVYGFPGRGRQQSGVEWQRCALGVVYEAGAAGSNVGRPNRAVAQTGDRLGNLGPGLWHYDLFGRYRHAAF
jgi:hypothetical protein